MKLIISLFAAVVLVGCVMPQGQGGGNMWRAIGNSVNQSQQNWHQTYGTGGSIYMKACVGCNAQINSQARTCPRCGKPEPFNVLGGGILGGGINP